MTEAYQKVLQPFRDKKVVVHFCVMLWACTAVNTDDNSLRRPQGQTSYLGAFVFANLQNHAAAAYAVRGTAEAGQLKPAHGPNRSDSCAAQYDHGYDADGLASKVAD